MDEFFLTTSWTSWPRSRTSRGRSLLDEDEDEFVAQLVHELEDDEDDEDEFVAELEVDEDVDELEATRPRPSPRPTSRWLTSM